MPVIKGIWAREVLNSSGLPAIECTLWLDTGGIIATSVPSGTSVGKFEAQEIEDHDENRMVGQGVLTAVNNINTMIAPQLIGQDPANQQGIDQLLVQLDGTKNKSKLGANTLLAVSQAVLKAGALSKNIPTYYHVRNTFGFAHSLFMPVALYTLINGGEHGANNLDIQEFQVIPASHLDFPNSLNLGVTLFQRLEEVLIAKKAIHSVGIVGGFTPNLYSNTDVFEILIETAKTTPFTFTQDLFFGIDAAATNFFNGGKYYLKDRSEGYSSSELLEYYQKIKDLYRVFYIEDPFQEEDHKSWQKITAELGETTRIIGDNLLTTHLERTKVAIEKRLCNTLLVKPNQAGTISETVEVVKLAQAAGWQVVTSHRSEETNDDLIADFAVGIGSNYVKFGPPNRGERVAKYNRLLMIDQEIKRAQASASTQNSASKNTPQPTAIEQNSSATQTPIASNTSPTGQAPI